MLALMERASWPWWWMRILFKNHESHLPRKIVIFTPHIIKQNTKYLFVARLSWRACRLLEWPRTLAGVLLRPASIWQSCPVAYIRFGISPLSPLVGSEVRGSRSPELPRSEPNRTKVPTLKVNRLLCSRQRLQCDRQLVVGA